MAFDGGERADERLDSMIAHGCSGSRSSPETRESLGEVSVAVEDQNRLGARRDFEVRHA